jgi:hypothetical protein
MGKTNFVFNVVLEDRDARNLTDNLPGVQLASVACDLLRDLARGGVMLPPEWASRIDAAIHTTDAATIVKHVERSVGKSGEAVRVEWIVDPTQIQFYQHLADNASISLEMQLKALMDYAYSQGWFNTGAPEVFKLMLAPEQYRWLQQAFGKDVVTGQDVIDQLAKNMKVTFPPDMDDDLVLEALQGAR